MMGRISPLEVPVLSSAAIGVWKMFSDLDLSEASLPAGTRLSLGTATIEVTDQPHRGCAQFSARFGVDALRFVNGPAGRELRLRGINAKVVVPGRVRRGDPITVCPPIS